MRLLLVWLAARRSLRTTPPHERPSGLDEYRTPMRVMPNDLDLLRHMNNGVFFTLLDIGRVDLLVRSGAQHAVRSQGWYPVVVGESIRFRRSLTLWERFEIVTRVLGWDERIVYLEQRFERAGRDGRPEVVAEAWIVARFLRRTGGAVPACDVAAAFGLDGPSPQAPEAVLAWSRSLDLAHRPTDASPDGHADAREPEAPGPASTPA
ncbi:acyl-CoA thioesterase [Cellulomonas chengniuliangii]|uniref:acyl-CoA thioesterase n=1 Tax=Cellulomonas chengniuliangii TaxID=2968084 RepID=UPI001D0DD0D5|nr:acyl-CoA thioesterase [Cellulomonas chengniuliangii]MCC2317655.1 acyl-CoA thioesterase [Cellulomonas chengniuliangii]